MSATVQYQFLCLFDWTKWVIHVLLSDYVWFPNVSHVHATSMTENVAAHKTMWGSGATPDNNGATNEKIPRFRASDKCW
jgi:hypothetical protein